MRKGTRAGSGSWPAGSARSTRVGWPGAEVGDAREQGVGFDGTAPSARIEALERVAAGGDRVEEAGGGVLHLVGLQANGPGAQARFEGPDVAGVEPRGDEVGDHGREDHQARGGCGPPRSAARLDHGQGDEAAQDAAQLVEAHVDDGLGGPLALGRHRGEEQLVARAEERGGEHGVPAPGQDEGEKARVEERGQGRRGRRSRGAGSTVPLRPEPFQGRLVEQALGREADDAHPVW